VTAGAGGAQKGSWGAWAGVVAEDSGDVCGGRGEGGADRGGPWRSKGESERAGQRLGDWQNGPVKQREKRGARAKITVPTAWPHWAAREREESAGEGVAADRRIPPVRRRERAAWLGRAGPARLLCLFLFPWIF
jgi:hypothetical protein